MKHYRLFLSFAAIVIVLFVLSVKRRHPSHPSILPGNDVSQSRTDAKVDEPSIVRLVGVQRTIKERNKTGVTFSGSDNTLMPFQHQLTIHRDLELLPNERKAVESIYAEYQEIKAIFEAPLVRRETSPAGAVVLSIPTYPEAGKELRKLLYAELRHALPPEKFEKLDDEIGGFIDDAFLGFGSLEQSFVVTPTHIEGMGPAYNIERKLSRSKSSPMGPWVRSGFVESTGTDTLNAEQLISGEFSCISGEVFRSLGKS